MAIGPGSRLGPYEVTALLGEGGMGKVWRAHHTGLKRDDALKVLPDAFASDADRLARFRREAQVLASLNHSNIAHVYGLEQSDGVQALVMELVEGPTLADRIAQGPIPVDEALPIAKQIAEALEAAHEQNIIHRDLKPANIKLRPDGTVKVLDFGLAKALEPTSLGGADATASPTITSPAMMTGVGMLLGTAAYMSPEQARGKTVDKRTDIWAFGCVLYEMLTGTRAFRGEDVTETLAAVVMKEPDWSVTPVAAIAVLRGCLQKDRTRRVRDIGDAWLMLESAFDTPRSHPADTATTVFWWRRPIALAGVGTLFLGLVAAGAWGFLRDIEGPPVARFSISLTQGGTFSATAQQNLAISPDGTQIVYSSNARLFRRMLAEFETRELAGTETDALENSPAFSPDGRSIAFVREGAIRRLGIDGGVAVMLCAVETLPFGLTWDGSGILVGQGPQGIGRCPASGGRLERLATVNEGEQAYGPQILPGTDLLMFTVSSLRDGPDRWDTANVVMQSLSSGNRTTIVRGGSDARYLPTGHLVYGVSGTVFAVSFDPRNPSRIGSPVPVIQGVRRSLQGTTGAVHVATSDAGVLLYIPGPVQGRSARRSIGMADRGGTVVRAAVADGAYTQVRASRDGKFLALAFEDTKEAIVSILALDGASAARRLTFEGRNRFPVWSPDGVRVAFQSDRDGDVAVFGQRADGTGVAERLTRPEKGEAHAPASWSPDGKTLLFTLQRDDTYALWSLSIDSGATARVGDVRSGEPLDPVFSPDGRWMAYHVGFGDRRGPDRNPDSGVYVQPFPPSGARYQAPRVGADFHPAWSPDGSSLIYVPSAASGQMAVVPVTKGTGITFGAPAQMRATVTGLVTSQFSRAYDILPDGRLVGLLSAGDDPSATGVGTGDQMRVVLNWFDELRRLVPAN